MEHRDPPRITAGDRRFDEAVEEVGGRFRLRQFDPTAPDRRQVGVRHASLIGIAALAVLAGLFYLASHASRAAVNWLHHQANYQLPFDEIHLVGEPPPWYRGGAHEFLERVRRGARESERISVFEVGPERLSLAFKKYAWVEDVINVVYEPGRILVTLRYRRPVARVALPDGQRHIVDENGIILAPEDVDLEQLGPLIKISGDGISAPADPRPGVLWKAKTGATEMASGEPRILAAAKLAGFLRAEPRIREAAASPALRILEIIATEFSGRGLFILNAELAEIHWGKAPGDESPGAITGAEKWLMLVRWQQTTQARCLIEGDFWAIGKNAVRHVCPHPEHSHQPSACPQAGRNQPGPSQKVENSG
jgi:hypothetical protein